MSQFKVDPATGALVRENGAFVRVSGLEEVAQHARVRLRLHRGEIPWDLSRGVRYQGFVLEKGTPPNLIEGELISNLLGTPGIVAVEGVSATLVGRHATFQYQAFATIADASARIPLHDTISIAYQREAAT